MNNEKHRLGGKVLYLTPTGSSLIEMPEMPYDIDTIVSQTTLVNRGNGKKPVYLTSVLAFYGDEKIIGTGFAPAREAAEQLAQSNFYRKLNAKPGLCKAHYYWGI